MINANKYKYYFILGAGRSGTKFLRDILGSSSNIAIIPYDVGYVWRFGNENYPHDEFTPDMLTVSIKEFIRNTLPKLIEKSANKSSPSILIEKSVPNTLRPAYIQSIYPNARFVHLIRDGRAVTESAMRLWQAPPERGYLLKKLKYFPWENYQYAFKYIGNILKGKLSSNRGQQTWGPLYKGIQEDVKSLPLEIVCARQWQKCVENSKTQLADINSKNIIEVHYEDLMKDSTSLHSICNFLGIDDSKTVIDLYDAKVVRSNTQKWKKSLTSQQLDLINQEIGELNNSLGYE